MTRLVSLLPLPVPRLEVNQAQALISAILAAVTIVNGNPFPPSATTKPTDTTDVKIAFFGHRAGNFQPSTPVATNATKTTSELGARVLHAARQVGEWVSNSAVARWDQNIQDGIGNGQDRYQMYVPSHSMILQGPGS